jgi:hypothetical protein
MNRFNTLLTLPLKNRDYFKGEVGDPPLFLLLPSLKNTEDKSLYSLSLSLSLLVYLSLFPSLPPATLSLTTPSFKIA